MNIAPLYAVMKSQVGEDTKYSDVFMNLQMTRQEPLHVVSMRPRREFMFMDTTPAKRLITYLKMHPQVKRVCITDCGILLRAQFCSAKEYRAFIAALHDAYRVSRIKRYIITADLGNTRRLFFSHSW